MQLINKYPQIEVLKNRIINLVLIFSTSLGFIAYFLSLFRYKENGFELSFVTDFIILLVILGITIFRDKLSIKVKSYVGIAAIYLFFLFDTVRLGILGADKVLLILVPFSALLVFSLKKSMAIFIFTIFSFLVLAYLHLSGYFVTPKDPITLTAWIINILLIVIVAFAVVIIQNFFNTTYTRLISELESNNQIISEKERNYREIFNASTDAIFIHDLDGKILDVNCSMLKMYGYEPAEIASISIADLSSQLEGFTSKQAIEFVEKAIKGESPVFDWQAKRKNGNLFWVEVALKKTQIGDHERVLAIVRDITEKKEDALQLAIYRNQLKELVDLKTKELEQTNEELQATNDTLAHQKEELVVTLTELRAAQQQLIHSEKMASLGILTAGVAHEINNPLNFINGGIIGLESYFEHKLPEHYPNVLPLINAINEGVKRAAGIVSSLNHYSRSGNLPHTKCNVNAILDNCLIMLQSQLKYKVEVLRNFTDKEYLLKGSESKLHQAFLNVIANAVQAINHNGIISITTIVKDFFLIINIKDNGSGISNENLGKVFDPFFTTKEPGKGTGLGLAITYNIIQEHLGKIEFESEPGKGTNVIIRLPISTKE